MRIKKVSQTTSTQAQVVDGYSTSATDSYSCNYVNGMNTYSTNEIRVGTWMNKPLYRKVLDVGSKTFSSGDNYIAHGINNFERAIYLKYTMFFGNNNYVLWDKLLTLQATSTDIIASTTGSNSFTQVYFILEYTKTTD